MLSPGRTTKSTTCRPSTIRRGFARSNRSCCSTHRHRRNRAGGPGSSAHLTNRGVVMDWNKLADRALSGAEPERADALAVLESPDDELLGVLDASFRVRQRYHGRDVRIHVLQNAKSGLCPEDCAFCSQSVRHHSGVDRYQVLSVDELYKGARKAAELGAVKYCMVTSTRGPSQRELDVICAAVRRIKADLNINICTSLGILSDGQAEQL